MGAVLVQSRRQLDHTFCPIGGDRGNHRHLPYTGLGVGHDQGAELAHHPLHSVQVGFVDGEEIRDLRDAGLDHLDPVPRSRCGDHHHRVGDLTDLQLRLTHPYRLHDDHFPAQGAQEAHRAAGGQGDAAQMAPRSHAANEHTAVQGVPLHADPIAQDGTAGEGTVGVDGEDGDPALLASPEAGQTVGQRALAAAGGPGQADDVGGEPGPVLSPG